MKQPNILFFLPDQHRPDWLGCNSGLPLRTPSLDRLAAGGVRFRNAFTPSPVCSPARACLATGRDYRRCGVRNNGENTPLSRPTYYGRLRDAGYEVAGVGKFDLHKPDLDWGLDGSKKLKEYGFTRGIDNEGKGDALIAYRKNGNAPRGPYMRFLEERGWIETHLAMYEPFRNTPDWLNFSAVTDLPDEAYCDNWVADNGMRFLQDFSRDKPWHLVVNFTGPHGPFDVTAGMRARWENVDFPPPVASDDAETAAIRDRRRNYAAMIENIDSHVGRMIDRVARRGERDNTLIVYSSDHGEMLGDHGRWGKSIWYTPATGIPMIVAGPGLRGGGVSDALVSLHDLAATFMDFAGAQELPDSDARSLRGVLEGRCETHREFVTSGLGEWDMVFDGRFKYIDKAAGMEPALYDIEKDPRELRNLVRSEPDVAGRLAKIMESKKTD